MPIKKSVNEDFFKVWSPEMAYLLGFFCADGTITRNKNGSTYFALQIADKKLLEKIKNTLKSEHKISKRVHKKNNGIFFRIQIGSNQIVSSLEELGIVPDKTKRMELPKVPKSFFGSFVRGFFDGDGNVWVGEVHRERKKRLWVIQTGFTSCSKEFLLALQTKLEEYGIFGSCYGRVGYNVFRLQYSVKSSILLFRLMYSDVSNGLFLARKKQVFDNFINNTRR